MRSLARWGSLPLVAVPLNSWALGLGEIESNSFLNQPLNAEIALSATAEELATLRVSLAPVNSFVERGIEFPAFLNSVDFEVTRNDAGENVIVVTSTQSIAEPFVTFLVQVTHARGGFTREYSVLLDPPLFLPPEAQTPQIAEPVALEPAADVSGGSIERAAVAPAPAPAVAPATTAGVQPRPQPVAPAATDGTDYTVQAGDTLWGIASNVRPAGVSMNQAMLSIYEANPSAFNGNINRLRRGAILRIPPSANLGGIAAASATAEVQRQIDIWRNEVQATPQLVLLPPSEDTFSGSAVTGGSDPAAVNALEGRVTGLETELAATEAELAEARRLLELRSAELADLQGRLGNATEVAPEPVAAEAAPQADPLERLESEPLFVDDFGAESEVAEADVIEAADAATEVPAAAAVSASSAPVVSAPSEPSLIDRILGFLTQPIIMIAGGVLAVVLAALAFLRRRRDRADDVTGQWERLETEMEEEADHTSTAQLKKLEQEPDMVVVEGSDGSDTVSDFDGSAKADSLESDFDEFDDSIPGTQAIESLTRADFGDAADLVDFGEAEAEPEFELESADQTMSSQTVINLDQADPIAEADFHMAYGLYDQAADLITKALETEPENREFKLKLLEVYFVWGNKEEFLAAAAGLHQDIGQSGNADWDKVVIMGKQICPDELLFSEATAAAPEIDLTLEASGVTTGLDFAFDGEGDEEDLDLDIGLGIVEDDNEPDATNAAPAESVDEDDEDETSAGVSEFLDIGERTQAGLKAAFFEDMADDDEFAAPNVDDVDIEGAMADSESEEAASELEFEELESTQEAPAFEDESEDFAEGLTLEAPTVESESAGAPTLAAPGLDAPTVETPMMDEATLEAPAFDPESLEEAEEIEAIEIEAEEEAEEVESRVAATGEMSSVRLVAGGGGTEMTAEIEIDDLGLDVGEFDDLDVGGADGASGTFSDLALDSFGADADDEQLSATGVTKVLDQPEDEIESSADAEIEDDEATVMAPGFDIEVTGTSTEVLEQPVGDFDPDQPAAGEDLNFDDFSSALEGADTVERPAASDYRSAAAATASQGGSVTEMTGTTQIGPIDPQAMSEVGTKLDLARAYIDMGDPEGARSILEEVLNEGNDSQRNEAQSLLDSL